MAVFIDLAALHGLGIARCDAAAEFSHRAERLRQRLDAKVGILLRALFERCDQLVHLALRLLVLEREEHARFDVHQMRRHRDELARHFKVELFALLEIGEILLQNESDRNVLDLYFIFRKQEENEIERTFKVLQRFRAALMHHAFQLENGIVHDIPLFI